MTTSRTLAATTHKPAPIDATAAQPISLEKSASGVSLYRIKQVLARIPVSRSSWFAGIKLGRYPRGYSISPRTTVWRSDEIDGVISSLNRAVDTFCSTS